MEQYGVIVAARRLLGILLWALLANRVARTMRCDVLGVSPEITETPKREISGRFVGKWGRVSQDVSAAFRHGRLGEKAVK